MKGDTIHSMLLALAFLGSFPESSTTAQEVISSLETSISQECWDLLQSSETMDLSYYEDYENDLLENPVNLGEIKPLELLRLGLLSREEMEALYQYLLDYGPMLSVYELQSVEGISKENIAKLARYVYVRQESTNKITLKDVFRLPRLEVLTSGKRVIETKAGFKEDSAFNNYANYYQGSPWQQNISIRGSSGKKVSFGIKMRNNPGEQPLSTIRGFHFRKSTLNISISDMGILQKAVFGSFGVSVGQGLTLGCNSGMSMNKEADLRIQSRGIFPSLSFNEEKLMRGAAVLLGAGKVTGCIFYSKKNKELDRGFCFSTGGEKWKSGLSILFHQLSDSAAADLEPYQFYNWTGDNLVLGWDGILYLKKVNFFHEVAVSSKGKTASIIGTSFSPSPLARVSLMVVNIQGGWNNTHANPGMITSNGLNQFEINANVYLQISRYFELKLFTEGARYRWLRYGMSSPSDKSTYYILFACFPSKTSEIDFYFKSVNDQYDTECFGKTDSTVNRYKYYMGALCKFKPVPELSVQFSAKVLCNRKNIQNPGTGWLIAQDVACWPVKDKVRLNFRLAFFQSDSFEERLYAWEPDVYQGYSVPSYSGRGYQAAAVVQCHLCKWLDGWIKYSVFTYPGRVSLSEGPEMINGNNKSEITLQLRIKLNTNATKPNIKY